MADSIPLSIVLLGIWVQIRLKLNESPLFLEMKIQGKTSKAPLTESFTRWPCLRGNPRCADGRTGPHKGAFRQPGARNPVNRSHRHLQLAAGDVLYLLGDSSDVLLAREHLGRGAWSSDGAG